MKIYNFNLQQRPSTVEPLPDLTKIAEAAAKLEDYLDVLLK